MVFVIYCLLDMYLASGKVNVPPNHHYFQGGDVVGHRVCFDRRRAD